MQIFVGNIPASASDGELRQLFETYGQVHQARISTDRVTGRARGFGFVDMPRSGEAEEAIADLHGTVFMGRPLTVAPARPRPTPEPPGTRQW